MRQIGASLVSGKSGCVVLLLSCLLMPVIAGLAQGAGPYEISWYTVDSGGGVSSGGPYVLTGTIGQADVGWSNGGKYELLGGFWQPGLVFL